MLNRTYGEAESKENGLIELFLHLQLAQLLCIECAQSIKTHYIASCVIGESEPHSGRDKAEC